MKIKPENTVFIYLVLILGGGLLFFPLLGKVALFDWDEVNFAEIAREMIVTGNYLDVQVDFRPFWEKPPLFIWLQVLSMKLFGINEYAARFPNALGGIVTLVILFQIGKKVYNSRMGLTWAVVYAGSILPFVYFKSGIIDPWFNLFIFTGVYFATLYLVTPGNRNRNIFISGLLIGLGILTKGPVALLIFGLTAMVYLVVERFRVKIRLAHILLFFLGLVITGGSWFIILALSGNIEVVRDFIVYQVRLFSTKDAGHGGFPLYHVVILMLGVFPASAFLFGGLRKSADEDALQRQWRRVCIMLLLTVVVLFEIVQTKIVHYSSLAYFPLTFLGALAVHRILEDRARVAKLSYVLLAVIGSVLVVAVAGLAAAGLHKEKLIASGLFRDPFALANLQADVAWNGTEALVLLPLIIALVIFFISKNRLAGFFSLFAGTMVFTFLTLAVFTGRIEGYSQRAAREFYQERSGEDCYIRPLGFKSYAHLFYSDKQPQANPLAYDPEWLLNGDIDKPAYFVYKITKKQQYAEIYPQLTLLYEKNGFIFAARYPREKTADHD